MKMITIENCGKCPFSCVEARLINEKPYKKYFLQCKKTDRECPERGFPDWCPLPKMPEKKAIENDDAELDLLSEGEIEFLGIKRGWNACIDEIFSNIRPDDNLM